MNETSDLAFEESSGNVFEDLGFDGPTATRLAHKADLVAVLRRYREERGLSQMAFSKLVGIPQPRLSRLFNGRIDEMSTDKLLDAIVRLGACVTIRVETSPEAAKAGQVATELA